MAYECCRGPSGKVFAKLMKEKFDVLKEYDIDAHFSTPRHAVDPVQSDIDSDSGSDSDGFW